MTTSKIVVYKLNSHCLYTEFKKGVFDGIKGFCQFQSSEVDKNNNLVVW